MIEECTKNVNLMQRRGSFTAYAKYNYDTVSLNFKVSASKISF